MTFDGVREEDGEEGAGGGDGDDVGEEDGRNGFGSERGR